MENEIASPAALPERKTRWFHLTPERLVGALLLAEIFLWLSDRCGWFGLSESKNLAVLLAIGLLGLSLLMFFLGYLSALVYRRRFQFGIRTLLLLMLAVAVPFSWLAVEIEKAKRQKEIVDFYNTKFEVETHDWLSAPNGLRILLGDLFFKRVYFLCTTESQFVFADEDLKRCCDFDGLEFAFFSRSSITDAGLENIGRLTRLKYLDLRDTTVTDAGLKYLSNLSRLENLDLNGTNVTEAGVRELQAKLPHCKIAW
jgi:hypothetical protein